MADKKSFLLYTEYKEHLALLNDEERGKLLMGLFEYAETGIEPYFDGMLKMAFSFIKTQMDRDLEKYESVCERNKANGAKGGRPSKKEKQKLQKPSGIFGNPDKPPKADNDNVDEDYYYDDFKEEIIKEKKIYGEFQNVFLTDEEYQKLQDKFSDYQDRIESLSAYVASNSKKYSSHYATILSWDRRANKLNQNKTLNKEEVKWNMLP